MYDDDHDIVGLGTSNPPILRTIHIYMFKFEFKESL